MLQDVMVRVQAELDQPALAEPLEWSFREDQRQTFDPAALAAAVASFPLPRTPGQDALSWSWSPAGEADVSWAAAGELAAGSARAMFWGIGHRASLGFREGRSFRLGFGPGIARLASFDATRRERAAERVSENRNRDIDLAALFGEPSGAAGGAVECWSARSRSRMVAAFGAVDWSELDRCYCGVLIAEHDGPWVTCELGAPMPLAMVTLTYPNDFLAVAPDGASAKRQLVLLRKRWARALGYPMNGAWKLEFQSPRQSGRSKGERAPHFHILVPVPALVGGELFARWLSRTWADCVSARGWGVVLPAGVSGPLLEQLDARQCEYVKHLLAGTSVDFAKTGKMSDPKRCGVYFLKHGTHAYDSKEYQHIVPTAWRVPGKGPGRFWGFWGLKPAVQVLDLDPGDFIAARRVLRHVAKSGAARVAYSRARAAAAAVGRGDAECVRLGLAAPVRKLRSLGAGGQLSGGFVVVNDGVRLAGEVAAAVRLRRSVQADWGNGVGLVGGPRRRRRGRLIVPNVAGLPAG